MTFLPDEVVGVHLQFAKDLGRLPRAVAVERPDVPAHRALGRSPHPRRAIFLSDLHIGSRSFLSEPWAALVEFLRGRGAHPELAASIDHVVIAGDLVDGIGIYPRQERDLAISDVVEQYVELGRRLGELPERLTVVAIPGNHDAVCPAEPQPALPANLTMSLPTNVRVLSNPSTFSLHGVVVQAYHGRSFDDLIPAIPGAIAGVPLGILLFKAANSGGVVAWPPAGWLVAAVLGTLAAVAAMTCLPAWLGTRQSAASVLQAEMA